MQENLTRRQSQLDSGELLVAEEVDRFVVWLRSRAVVPTVVALRRRFESIRSSELSRLEPKLASLSPESRQRVDEVTRLLVEKLLIAPTEHLKSINDQEMVAAYADALNHLFNLPDKSSDNDAEKRPQPTRPAERSPRTR